MDSELTLEIVTPERQVVTCGVYEVILPSVDGYLGVRPGHAPLLARLDVGEISYRTEGRESFLAVGGGFVEVLPDRVVILAQTCEPAEEIDAERAEHARIRAEEAMRKRASETEFDQAEMKLRRAITRLKVHGRGPG